MILPPPAPDAPALPPCDRAALLLDLDGTLLDIAPRPDAVAVADGLPETLRALRAALGDALAIVTGRPIAQVDALLPGIPYAVAGEHGSALRRAPDAPIEYVSLPNPPAYWAQEAERLANAHPGALVEPKRHGFVLHYRGAPSAGPALRDALAALIARDAHFILLAAHMAHEVKPRGTDKGSVTRALMERPPFAGRLPIFIGDDVTDEDGMEAARAFGGTGLRVPDIFGDAAGVRRWLAHAARGEAGEIP